MLMNCQSEKFTCDKGQPEPSMEKILEHLKTMGVAEEGCNNYYANEELNCSNLNKCKDCENGEEIGREPICTPKRFQVYKLKDYGKIEADSTKSKAEQQSEKYKQMLEHLTNKGPLIC